MFRALSIALAILACCVPRAHAQSACEMINDITQTVAVVRDIETDFNDRNFDQNIETLDSLIKHVALPALIPANASAAYAGESRVVFQYISSLREAVAGAQSGYTDYAKTALMSGNRSDLSQSLFVLDNHWKCGDSHRANDAQERGVVTPDASVGRLPGAAGQSKPDGSVAGSAVGRGQTSSDVISTGISRSSTIITGAREALTRNSKVFLWSVAGIIIIIILLYARKRSRGYQTRESRKLIQKHVRVRIGKDYYTMLIVDISMNGAKIQHADMIHDRKKLHVELCGQWHKCNIKWSNAAFAGTRFQKPIDGETFLDVVQSGTVH